MEHHIDLTPKHLMRVPGTGVLTAPQAVARLFHLHRYTQCPRSLGRKGKLPRILYPILRPNVYHSPRMRQLRTSRKKRMAHEAV